MDTMIFRANPIAGFIPVAWDWLLISGSNLHFQILGNSKQETVLVEQHREGASTISIRLVTYDANGCEQSKDKTFQIKTDDPREGGGGEEPR